MAREAQAAKKRHVSASCVDAVAAGGRTTTWPASLRSPEGRCPPPTGWSPPVCHCSDTIPHTLGREAVPSSARDRVSSGQASCTSCRRGHSHTRRGGQPPALRERAPGSARPCRPHRCGWSAVPQTPALVTPLTRPHDVRNARDSPRECSLCVRHLRANSASFTAQPSECTLILFHR